MSWSHLLLSTWGQLEWAGAQCANKLHWEETWAAPQAAESWGSVSPLLFTALLEAVGPTRFYLACPRSGVAHVFSAQLLAERTFLLVRNSN